MLLSEIIFQRTESNFRMHFIIGGATNDKLILKDSIEQLFANEKRMIAQMYLNATLFRYPKLTLLLAFSFYDAFQQRRWKSGRGKMRT